MISITIKMHTNVPYDYDKYSEAMLRIAKEFHNALAEGLKSTYSVDLAWMATSENVIISFRPGNNRRQFSNMPSGTIILDYIYLTIIAKDFDVLNMYVNKVIDAVDKFKYYLGYPVFNVAISGGDCEQQ